MAFGVCIGRHLTCSAHVLVEKFGFALGLEFVPFEDVELGEEFGGDCCEVLLTNFIGCRRRQWCVFLRLRIRLTAFWTFSGATFFVNGSLLPHVFGYSMIIK